MSSYSLKFKISAPIACFTIIILSSMTYFTTHRSFTTARETAETINRDTAHFYSRKVQVSLEESLLLTRTYSQAMFGRKKVGTPSREIAIAELEQILIQNKQIIGAWTGWEPNAFDRNDTHWVGKPGHDQTGRFVPYWSYENGKANLTPLLDYVKAGDGDYYIVPKERKKETFVEPYIYAIAGVPTLMTSAVTPVLIDGDVKGVVGVDLGLSEIQKEIAKIKPYETSEAYLLTNKGTWVAHHQSDLITKKATFPVESEKILSAVYAGEELLVTARNPEDGEEYLYVVAPISIGRTDQTWSLVIRTPTDTILAGAKSLMITQILIGVFGLVVLIVAVFFLVRKIAKDIGKLSGNLNTSATEVTSAITQLTGAGQVLSQSASESAASIQETVASLEEINSIVRKNADNAKLAANLSRDSMKAAQSGEAEVRDLVVKMNEISTSSKKIEDIISVIDDIAFQTNLLALNAAVEAARAGEQGKGFAVVAEAVRNLAQKSATAATDTTNLIKSSVTQVQQGKQKAESCGQILETIVSSIEKVSTLNEEISNASEEQASGVSQISTAMNRLDQSVQANASSAEEIAASSEEIDAQSKVMRGVVKTMDENIQGSDRKETIGMAS